MRLLRCDYIKRLLTLTRDYIKRLSLYHTLTSWYFPIRFELNYRFSCDILGVYFPDKSSNANIKTSSSLKVNKKGSFPLLFAVFKFANTKIAKSKGLYQQQRQYLFFFWSSSKAGVSNCNFVASNLSNCAYIFQKNIDF